MIEAAGLQGSGAVSAAIPAPAPADRHKSAFHQLLSELNPLQYLPVVGTIYRAVTGDTIPEAARIAGSMVVSGLMGGPVGLAINVGTTLFEKASGIDPEQIGHRMLALLGGQGHAACQTASKHPCDVKSSQPGSEWTEQHAKAYQIAGMAGPFRCSTSISADDLNGLELTRLRLVA